MRTKTEHCADYEKLWKGYNEEERRILLCLVPAISPFSLDSLMALSGTPAVTTLRVMEDLRRKRIVSGRTAYGKGFYCIVDGCLVDFLKENVSSGEILATSKRAIEHYTSSLP